MENSNPTPNINNNNNTHSKRTLRRNSSTHISMSDTESTTSQNESFHSPLRDNSPHRSDDPSFLPETTDKTSKSLVVVDKYYSPLHSPAKPNLPATSPPAGARIWKPWPHSEKHNSDRQGVVMGVSRLVREEQQTQQGVKKMGPVRDLEEGFEGGGDEIGGETRSRAAVVSILKGSQRGVGMRKVALVVRVFQVVSCLVSFSVMAADKTQGWSGDSFDRYKEYKFCLAVAVIGFVYSGFQAFNLACRLGMGKHVISHNIRYLFDFSMDQILAYLLMSASSSAATRVDDWISNWGKDQFTLMATASIAMAFFAFIAFATSSLISGYNFCNRE